MSIKILSCSLFVISLSLNFTLQADDTSKFIKQTPVSNQSCISCHENEAKEWRKSDHKKSMQIANKTTVEGNFNDQVVEHHGQKSHFFIKNNQYFTTVSYDEDQQTFPIKFTFGHFPLQQYLVETERGKLQVLPFAWDNRTTKEGGQRWYHNYSNEEIRPEDRLHWRQPLQNWNGMCADCHSDGLIRNYQSENDQFNSQWDNINVGCLSCHGDMSEHSAKQLSPKGKKNKKTKHRSVTSPQLGLWLRSVGEKSAHWQGAPRDNTFMDNCFFCHSLRSPLTDGFAHNKPFLDQFTPQLLQSPMYHADGQIKEEVYVYGSFLQSKMYAAGVNCLDCHDKHTMKIKVQGNGLCLQCHNGEIFNVSSHHRHQEKSEGAQCVNCHMPNNRYMGVDDRRDHSFKIPRPDISQKHASPNACSSCHKEKNNEWAKAKLFNWHGEPKKLSSTRQDLMSLQSSQAISMTKHLAIIADENIDIISRATALQLLGQYGQLIPGKVISPYIEHENGLLRLSAASLGSMMSLPEQEKYIKPLLGDKLKAVRVNAARALVGVKLSVESSSIFKLAYQELITANQINSWRGEGKANQAIQAMALNNLLDTERKYKEAIKIDPYFEQAYTNLSEFYRQTQRIEQSKQTLKQALKNLPKASSVLYAYGLHLVREQKHQQAVLQFKRAYENSPNQEQYIYTYVLALDSVGQTKQGLETLLKVRSSYRGSQMVQEMGMYLAQKLQDKTAYDLFNKL